MYLVTCEDCGSVHDAYKTKFERGLCPECQHTTRLARFIAYANNEIDAAYSQQSKAKIAARAAARLEQGYAELWRTEGDSDPGAYASDYLKAITTFDRQANEYSRG